MLLKDKHWCGARRGHVGGEGPEIPGEVFSMKQVTLASHDKKPKRQLRIGSNGRLLRRSYATKRERSEEEMEGVE
jgi:hypothetical protein